MAVRICRRRLAWNSLPLLLALLPGSPAAAAPAAPPAKVPASSVPEAADLRLGDEVVPTAERLDLRLDPVAAGYSGTATIDLRVSRPVSAFRFHAEEMQLARLTLQPAGGGEVVTLQAKTLDDGLVEVTSPRQLPPGAYQLTVAFSNDWDAHSVGLYRVQQNGKSYVFTQLEADDARRAFPCFDEPRFKIPWQIALTVPSEVTAASNAPVAAGRGSGAGRWRFVTFAATPPLPSYLVAIAVGPFDVVEMPGMSVPVRVLAPAGEGKLTGMAVEMTPRLLIGLEG